MRRRNSATVIACCIGTFLVAPSASAQGRGGQNWSTYNADAQRTSWMRTDPRISRESVQKPAFQFLWKTKLDNQPRQLNSLTQALLLGNIISYKGFKALAFVGGSADNVYSIDYDLNRMFWTRHLTSGSSASGTAQCPGGLTAIARPTPLVVPNPATARGAAGAAPPQPAPGAAGRGVPPAAQPPPAPARTGGPPPNSNLANAVYAIASDGTVHVLNPQTGQDLSPPKPFLRPSAKVTGSILVDNLLYASTADGCGGEANGVHAIDLTPDAATEKGSGAGWPASGASVVGDVGPTVGTDGTIYVATSDGDTAPANSVIALQPKTLAHKDSFSPGKSPFTSAPIVFPRGDKEIIAAANKDGRIYLLDSGSLGGADHKTPAGKSPPFNTSGSDGLATWEDSDGTRWIVAASAGSLAADARIPTNNGSVTNGTVVGFKVIEQGGALALQPAWAARDIPSPGSPIVINGVIFVLARGGQRSGPAVLYALDGLTGKELWNSGTTITSFVHSGGLSGEDGQVYVGTYDSTLYAFGIALEH